MVKRWFHFLVFCPDWLFQRALKYLLENGQGIQTSKNKFKRKQLWDGEAADACLYKQLIQNEKNKRKKEYSEPSGIIVVMEVMGGKHTFYRNIFCRSFCETGQMKEVLVYWYISFSRKSNALNVPHCLLARDRSRDFRLFVHYRKERRLEGLSGRHMAFLLSCWSC